MSAKSKRAGRVYLRNGGGAESYEALVPQECAACEETIPVGDRFIRVKMIGGGHANLPHCQNCEPHYSQSNQGSANRTGIDPLNRIGF